MGSSVELPYFGGEEGRGCVLKHLEKFQASQSPKKEELASVMASDLYQTALSRCGGEIEVYNRAGGLVCLLEEESSSNITYAKFWDGSDVRAPLTEYQYTGYAYYDGEYDLATMFGYTNNFTSLAYPTTCVADCYTGEGKGCSDLAPYLPLSGTISKEQLCGLQWTEIEYAYQSLRVCASKAIANPVEVTKAEYVLTAQSRQISNNNCLFKTCNEEE